MAENGDAVVCTVEVVTARAVNRRACVAWVYCQRHVCIRAYGAVAMELNNTPVALADFRQVQSSRTIATRPRVHDVQIFVIYGVSCTVSVAYCTVHSLVTATKPPAT